MYSIDTSALIDGWVRYYPPATFASLWESIEALIASGHLKASKEVLDELERQDDDLSKWAKEQKGFLVDTDDPIQDIVEHLMATYPDPDKPEKGISGADPFVIALALTHNPPWKVVTGEKPGSVENPKIPYVCANEGVKSMSFLQMLQSLGWTF